MLLYWSREWDVRQSVFAVAIFRPIPHVFVLLWIPVY